MRLEGRTPGRNVEVSSMGRHIEELESDIEVEPPYPQVVAIFIAPDAGVPMQEVASVHAIAGVGLEGDRYANGTGSWLKEKRSVVRHVTLVSLEAIDEANATQGTDFTPQETRRNIVVMGIDLNELVGRDFTVGTVRMQGVERCEPCARPSNLIHKKGFEAAFQNRGGLRAEIVTDGVIQNADRIVVMQSWNEHVREYPEELRNDRVEWQRQREIADEQFRQLLANEEPTPDAIERAWQLYEWIDVLIKGGDFKPHESLVELRKSLKGQLNDRFKASMGKLSFRQRTVSSLDFGKGILVTLSGESYQNALQFREKMLEVTFDTP